jgi:hypothetical protein
MLAGGRSLPSLRVQTVRRSGSPHECQDRQDDQDEDNDADDTEATDPCCKHVSPLPFGVVLHTRLTGGARQHPPLPAV